MTTERRKLELERMMLQMHRMRIKFGRVVRDYARTKRDSQPGRCIDCGVPFTGGVTVAARWAKWNVTGFRAHLECPDPFMMSEWLRDTDFIVIFDRFVALNQKCATHHKQATLRQFIMYEDGARLRYICEDDVK